MIRTLRRLWPDYLKPLIRRPDRIQLAAMCHRIAGDGTDEVLLITSRNTGRWIIPKGWPIDDLDAAGAAVTEAWEEAGVRPGKVGDTPLGTFTYLKRLNGDQSVRCEVLVFAVEVLSQASEYPEAGERQQRWMAPAKAAELVDEPDLAELLRGFGRGRC